MSKAITVGLVDILQVQYPYGIGTRFWTFHCVLQVGTLNPNLKDSKYLTIIRIWGIQPASGWGAFYTHPSGWSEEYLKYFVTWMQ
jgi:hypothetical protein